MTISKHEHSCLLVEGNGNVAIIDPGNYTYEDKALDLSSLDKLDYLLITHEHQDHFYLPFVKAIVRKFPSVQIITTPSIVSQLNVEGIQATAEGNDEVVVTPVPHEPVLNFPVAQNVQVALFDKLTHPGDSLHFDLKTPVLALPVQAPWGSMVEAVDKALAAKPEVIIPIHDWHWKDQAREAFYAMMTRVFLQHNISFKPLQTGEKVTV
jgi:L-ascorbate metabolism protein UlaG (beta-lactamase superfamily)